MRPGRRNKTGKLNFEDRALAARPARGTEAFTRRMNRLNLDWPAA